KSEARKKLGIDEDLFIILTISRIDYRKGHDIVLNAVAELVSSFPKLNYLIVGNGPNKSRLELLTEELHISENVKFTGFVAHEELEYYYSASDVFAMINTMADDTDSEGFG